MPAPAAVSCCGRGLLSGPRLGATRIGDMISRVSRSRCWTLLGLAIALLAMPAVLGAYSLMGFSLTTQNVLAREVVLLVLAGCLLALVRYKERLGWTSIGLQRPAFADTGLWVAITFVGVALAAGLAFGICEIFGWSIGSPDSSSFEALPTWVLL